MQWIFLDTENLVGVHSFKRVCFRFPEMPQELNCEEENKLIILTNWVLMSLHSEQLALLQAWILNNAIMCASQECKFRSCLTPQWLHWSSYAVTSEHNLNCSRGPAKGLCHASGRWWWCYARIDIWVLIFFFHSIETGEVWGHMDIWQDIS